MTTKHAFIFLPQLLTCVMSSSHPRKDYEQGKYVCTTPLKRTTASVNLHPVTTPKRYNTMKCDKLHDEEILEALYELLEDYKQGRSL